MQAVPIGLCFPVSQELRTFVCAAQMGRITHAHPTGYLGAGAVALFTLFARANRPLAQWGKAMLDLMPQVRAFLVETKEGAKHVAAMEYFVKAWTMYVQERGIAAGSGEAVFPERYGVEERDKFIKSVAWRGPGVLSGWGGSSGHDAPMIAYDALLGCDGDWQELLSRGAFHCGDSDTTAIIACSWFGMKFGFRGVPNNHIQHLEYLDTLLELADDLRRILPTE